ncbi:COPII coat assembly protein sec-16 [Taphrina deformans PYCC 5710]|uniref:Protein transport protein sec16 n=1 Tax=Taphrina deformans (strain PYCC 5710 / ATCC 11124 / CBS 356.35 / IMI 108563 / JCM 9778 / NBRC 8474) TaxID=1097556 RepID=R4XCM9_TAPDE|nr:COPII coat assembly protein sec-16 [Taphrina deformans PYCC 5710]|eukprot:CCG82131.1 COPII coat assembly protein sec-16 [Taphrina deformans PYCC 5710]
MSTTLYKADSVVNKEDHIQSPYTESEPHFNAAQIPHNLNSLDTLEMETQQIPIEQVLETLDESNNAGEVLIVQDDPGQLLYEHQALDSEELIVGRADQEALLPIRSEELMEDFSAKPNHFGGQDETEANPNHFDGQDKDCIIHDLNGSHSQSPDFLESNIDGDSDDSLNLSPTYPSTKNIPDHFATIEADTSVFDQLETSNPHEIDTKQHIAQLENERLQTQDIGYSGIPTISVPDDLDEADFNIDDELDADFAAMEASFSQKLSVSNSNAGSVATKQAPKVNPYLPPMDNAGLSANSGRYLPINSTGGRNVIDARQPSTTLFTPAQIAHSSPQTQASSSVATTFAPLLRPVTSQNRQTSASFVNAKAGYTDPYALPDVLVANKRARPPPQTLRGAASVPNLKAAAQLRPPVGQRHASTMGTGSNVESDNPPTTRPYSSQNNYAPPPSQQLNTRSTAPGLTPMAISQPYSNSATPTLSPPRKTNYETMRRIPAGPGHNNNISGPVGMPPPSRQLSYSQYAPDSAPQISTHAAHPNPVYASTSMANAQGQGFQPATTSRTQNQMQMQSGNQNSLNVPKSHYTPGALPRAPSPLRDTRASSIDAVMKGRPSPLQSGFVVNPQTEMRERHESSASSQSHDSVAPQDVAYSDYIDQQRHAETRMFGDSYAVAEDDIYEAQSIQRGSSAYLPTVSSLSTRQAPVADAIRPQSQPRSVLANSSNARTIPYTARRSLDEKNAAASLEMSRPSSRAADRYASTEPSHSPRQAHVMPYEHDGSLQMRGQKRPSVVSRATSSNQAYQQFPRVLSPVNPSYAHTSDIETTTTTDPLVGHPIARFGFGGKLLTTFPKRIPRFSPQGVMQHQIAGPGPISITISHDLLTAEILPDFPGPLVHTKFALKQKKADLQLWLAKRIPPGNSQLVDDKTLLYRTTAKDRLINLLYPDIANIRADDELANFKVVASSIQEATEIDQGQVLSTAVLTDSAVTRLSELLLRGDKQGALRFASDAKLWAHAFVIASRISPQCWSEVVQEFAVTELQTATESSESLKFLYQSFAGVKFETGNILSSYVLQNWRKCLTMVLSNRVAGDDLAVTALGHALLEHGSTYAAHFCYLLCSRPAIGPKDDSKSLFSIVGQHEIFGTLPLDRNEAILMSEIYEFCLSLAQPKFLGLPHLLAFKLQRAHLLSDTGHATVAKKYCEAITNALKALPKGSNHLHHVLIEQLRDLSERIDQVSGDDNPSWIGSKIAKPKMDIWGSLEGKFSKFVAGDSDDSQAAEANSKGPFAKLAQTPALSRVQSLVDVRNRVVRPTAGHNGGYEGEALQPVQAPQPADRNSYPYPEGDQAYSHTMQANGVRPSSSYLPDSNLNPVGQYAPPQFQAPTMYTPQQVNPVPYQSMQSTQPMNNQYLQPNAAAVQAHSTFDNASFQQINRPLTNATSVYPAQALSPTPYPVIDAMPQAPQSAQQAFNPYAPNMSQTYPMVAPVTVESTENYSQKGLAIKAQEPDSSGLRAPELDATVENKAEESKPSEQTTKADPKTEQSEEKKSGWLGGWFGGKKKEPAPAADGEVKVHKAKLGEGMSLVYDPVTKKWTNPKGAMPEETKTSAPPPPMMAKKAVNPAMQESKAQPAPVHAGTPPMSSPAPSRPPGGLAPGTIGRKLPQADDDLAAMLGTGPAPRRAASGSMGPPAAPGTASMRAKKGKPAKRYVDVFQGEA